MSKIGQIAALKTVYKKSGNWRNRSKGGGKNKGREGQGEGEGKGGNV